MLLPTSLEAAATVVVAWPVVAVSLRVNLPTAPSPTETLAITCASDSFIVVAEPTSQLARCPAVAEACLVVTATSPSLAAQFLVAARSPLSSAGEIECIVASRAVSSNDAPIIYPRYGSATSLSVPALALNTSFIELGAVLLESRAVPGVFTSVAGGGVGRSWKLSAANISASTNCSQLEKPSAANTSTISVEWSSGALLACPSATAALSHVASEVAALVSSSPPSFSLSVSGMSHMLLVASRPGRFPPSLAARMGNVSCVVNWVSPDGAFASITTPSFADLCRALGASEDAADCGAVRLSLESESWPTTMSRLSALSSSINARRENLDHTYFLPTTFSPMRAGENTASLIQAAISDATYLATAELPPSSALGETARLIKSTAGSSAFGSGIRVLLACSDPTFSPPHMCAAAAQESYEAPAGLICAWGAGDQCVPCPKGASCPGGRVLLPSPAYWAPSISSSPEQLVRCQEPSPAKRCPGWKNTSSFTMISAASLAPGTAANWCSDGFTGVACSQCPRGYFPNERSCVACPAPLSRVTVLTIILPFIFMALGLVIVGVVLIAALKLKGIPLAAAVSSVGTLSFFLWQSAQSSAALFQLTRSFAPSSIAPLYTLLSALQFAGVAVHPACLDTPPYMAMYVAAAITFSSSLLGATGLLLGFSRRTATPSAIGADELAAVSAASVKSSINASQGRGEYSLLNVAVTVLCLSFGFTVSTIAGVFPCTDSMSIPLSYYLTSLENDGSVVRAALSDRASMVSRALHASTSHADLSRAASDHIFAIQRQLVAALDAPVPVRLVAGDQHAVCYEGPHRNAWEVAAATVAVLAFVMAIAFVATLSSQPLHARPQCIHRCGSLLSPSRTVEAIVVAFVPGDIRTQAAWYVIAQFFFVALVCAMATLARMTSDTFRFIAFMLASMISQLALLAITLHARPFDSKSAWKNVASAAIIFLSATTPATTSALFLMGEAAPQGIAVIPLVIAFPIPIIILGVWWKTVAPPTIVSSRDKEVINAANEGAFATVTNPVFVRSTGQQESSPAEAGTVPIENETAAGVTWERIVDADGDVYFFNATTGMSLWDLPDGAVLKVAVSNDCAPKVGWERAVDSDGNLFYYHPETGMSLWEPPEGAVVTEEIHQTQLSPATVFDYLRSFDVRLWREQVGITSCPSPAGSHA